MLVVNDYAAANEMKWGKIDIKKSSWGLRPIHICETDFK